MAYRGVLHSAFTFSQMVRPPRSPQILCYCYSGRRWLGASGWWFSGFQTVSGGKTSVYEKK